MLVVVSHEATRVASVKDPAERFCKVIGGINDTRNVPHNNVSRVFPILDGKELNKNVKIRMYLANKYCQQDLFSRDTRYQLYQ